jgi:hypothetical protein
MLEILQFSHGLLKKLTVYRAVEVVDDLFGIVLAVIIVVYFIYSSVVANSDHLLFLVFICVRQGYGF